jgi:Transglutaminase-like superfamily
MSQNLERDFLDAVRRRNREKRKRVVQKIGTVVLIATTMAVALYVLFANQIIAGPLSAAINPKPLILPVMGLAFITGFILFISNNQALKDKFAPLAQRLKLHRLRRQHILIISLLLLMLIYQGNPSLLHHPLNEFMTRVRYNPQPATSNLPRLWREPQTIHPAIANMTPNVEKSIQSVAQYIAQQETDPQQRIKALHDYVISRITYDLDVLKTGNRPSQDAQTVFSTRKGVCEGYANLFRALGRAIDLDVVVVGGKIRRDLAPVDLIPLSLRLMKSNYDWTLHAWNAVKVDGHWQLIDTTWDDGDSADAASYSVEYLMPPPSVMIVSHLPELQVWQLLPQSKSESAFEQQPLLTPQFFAEDAILSSPTEYQTKVKGKAIIEIKQAVPPQGEFKAIFSKINTSLFTLWSWQSSHPLGQAKPSEMTGCQSRSGEGGMTRISCPFPGAGDYQVILFKDKSGHNSTRRNLIPMGQLRFHALSAG